MSDLILPKGYGFRALSPAALRERGSLLDLCTIWEAPRKRGQRRYVLGVDVGDGLGLDRSVIEVLRTGTIEDPPEQVAEYVSDSVPPMALAYVVQALGQYYVDADGVEAMAAIECNNHGLSTQDTLQLHLGYQSYYRWEYYDAAAPEDRYSRKIGWMTTPRTRPILLDKFYAALTTTDPITSRPDLLIHSSLLQEELKDFQTVGALWEAEAARGAHDDCIMALAIAHYVGWRLQAGEAEPLEERRRRRTEQMARQSASSDQKPDWRNSPATSMETDQYAFFNPAEDGDLDEVLYDPRRYEEPHGW